MNVLFTTSFRNEQGGNGTVPKRVDVVNNGTTVTTSVISTGFRVDFTNFPSAASWTLSLPPHATEQRYLVYGARITNQSVNKVAQLNLFGYSTPVSSIGSTPTAVCVIQDLNNLTSKAYIGGRYVGAGTIDQNITIDQPGTSQKITLEFTDLFVAESEVAEGADVTLNDLEVEEVENNWFFTGASLLDSLDKVNTTTLSPNAQVYREGGAFTVTGSPSKPVLIEGAGKTEGPEGVYGLQAVVDGNPAVSLSLLTAEQGVTSAIVGAGSEITISRTTL